MVGVARVGLLNVCLGVDVVAALCRDPHVLLWLGVVLFEGARLCCDGSRDGSSCPCFKGSESPYHPCPAGGWDCGALLLAFLAVARSFCRIWGLGWWSYGHLLLLGDAVVLSVVGELAFAPVVELLLELLLLVPCFLSTILVWLAAGGSWLVVGLVRGLRVDRVVGGEETQWGSWRLCPPWCFGPTKENICLPRNASRHS